MVGLCTQHWGSIRGPQKYCCVRRPKGVRAHPYLTSSRVLPPMLPALNHARSGIQGMASTSTLEIPALFCWNLCSFFSARGPTHCVTISDNWGAVYTDGGAVVNLLCGISLRVYRSDWWSQPSCSLQLLELILLDPFHCRTFSSSPDQQHPIHPLPVDQCVDCPPPAPPAPGRG
jgi:hypothetical protein